MTKQRTITVDEKKIKIKSRQRSSVGNHAGFHVWVNDTKFYSNRLHRQEAEDFAYAQWVKKCVGSFEVVTTETNREGFFDYHVIEKAFPDDHLLTFNARYKAEMHIEKMLN